MVDADLEDVVDGSETGQGKGPNWKAIAGSTTWRFHVEPWLRALYVEALEGMAPPGPPGSPSAALANLETYNYHRGQVDMLRKLLLTPQAEMEMQHATQEMQKQDETKQRAAAIKRQRRRATL